MNCGVSSKCFFSVLKFEKAPNLWKKAKNLMFEISSNIWKFVRLKNWEILHFLKVKCREKLIRMRSFSIHEITKGKCSKFFNLQFTDQGSH